MTVFQSRKRVLSIHAIWPKECKGYVPTSNDRIHKEMFGDMVECYVDNLVVKFYKKGITWNTSKKIFGRLRQIQVTN